MTIKAVKGTHDVLPEQVSFWQRMEQEAHSLFARYGYREIRTPLFEATEVFARGIGNETDIVSKEMYTFTDRGGESLTLRPEATAGIVRAVIEHNLVQLDPLLKVYLIGPMFRAEQPQKGRYRQFHQVDVEAFGLNEAQIDAEVIELALGYLKNCGLSDYRLLLNSVGDAQCRPAYLEVLRGALRKCAHFLCADCQRRAEVNPLRVLDCKVPADQPIIDDLPRMADHLCSPCREHYAEVKQELALLNIPYSQSHRLVRGLDYYVRTTFEVVSSQLGRSQNSVLGGGRYDGLVKQLGGPDVSGIGFALGMERLAILMAHVESTRMPNQPLKRTRRCDIFLAPLINDPLAWAQVRALQTLLRQHDYLVLRAREARGLKNQLKHADKLGATLVAILGEEELKSGKWLVKDLDTSDQAEVKTDDMLAHFRERLPHGSTLGGRRPSRPVRRCDIFLAPLSNHPEAWRQVREVRDLLTQQGYAVLRAAEARELPAQLTKAEKLGAAFLGAVGDEELRDQNWLIMNLKGSEQIHLKKGEMLTYIHQSLGKLSNG